ncbi:MAG: Na+/H+ antiporter subunit E [Microcoleus sp. CAN_BIN18]|nr:Na+/H+ antiporter subunit E [Microcoleus sp. CAN_BIN18]
MIGHLILRLTIWFLLTADFSLANIAIGVAIAFLLPRSYTPPEPLKEWFDVYGKILLAIPIAYLEAFELIFRPHRHEDIVLEKVPNHRSPLLIFLDVFLITFTPKTIVVKYREDGFYEVHRVRRTSSN